MSTVIVRTSEELKNALKSEATEIQIDNDELVSKIKTIALIKKAGPLAIAAIVAAIPFVPFTGGASLGLTTVGIMGASGVAASAGVIYLVTTIGGVLVISIFTDWEEVELVGIFKLKRKSKK